MAVVSEENPLPRTILHVDLDAFYAAVEVLDNPELAGKPLIVGGSLRRGVVSTCSYEARVFGVRSAMSMAHAMQRCPQAIVVYPRMQRYVELSREFFEILSRYSPHIEGLSLDEAFLDLTGTQRLLGAPRDVAQRLKDEVKSQLGLVVSCGVASTKFVAKIASDVDKPNGLRVVADAEVLRFLHPLPASRLWGVGRVTQEQLTRLGIRTIGDVTRFPLSVLKEKLGARLAMHLLSLATGQDSRDVEDDTESKSVGHREALDDDVVVADELLPHLLRQADQIAARLRSQHLKASTAALVIKFEDFRQITRQAKLPTPCAVGEEIYKVAQQLLRGIDIGDVVGKRVRMVGISATGLHGENEGQLSLHQEDLERAERLGKLSDQIREKFGDGALGRGIFTKKRSDSTE